MCDKQEPRQNDAKPPRKSDGNRGSNGRFLPGNVANPAGRPKGRTLWREIKDQLKARDYEDMKAVAAAYIEKAKGGSFPHAAAIIERQSGMVEHKSKIKIEGKVKHDHSLMEKIQQDSEALAAARRLADLMDPLKN